MNWDMLLTENKLCLLLGIVPKVLGRNFLSFLIAALFTCSLTNAATHSKESLTSVDSSSRANSVDSALVFALDQLRQAEEELGDDNVHLISILLRIGGLQERLNKFTEAKSYYNRALPIAKDELGEDHLDVAQILQLLAQLHSRTGQFREAEPLIQSCLDIRKIKLPPDHTDLASSWYEAGIINFNLGNYVQSFDCALNALSIWKLSSDTSVIKTYILLGNISLNVGKFDESEAHFRKAIEVSQDINGYGHPTTARGSMGLANLYYGLGRLAEAAVLYGHALEIFEQAFGPENIKVAATMINLAIVYQDKGMYLQAENYYSLALSIMEKNLGPNHIGYAKALEGVASSYIDQGRYAEADSLLKQALVILESSVGRENNRVTYTLNNLAEVKLRMGQPDEAANYELRAMQIINAQFGPDHLNLAEHLVRLGEIRTHQGRYEEAESLHAGALEIFENTTDEHNPSRAECLELLSDCYRRDRKADKCLEAAQRAVNIRLKNLYDFVEVVPEKDALAFSQHLRNSVNNYVSCSIDFGLTDKDTQKAVADLLLSTKGQVSDAIFERKKHLQRLLQTAESLRLAKFEVSQLYVAGASGDADDYRKKIDSLTELIDRMEAELAFNNSSYRQDLNRRTVTNQRISRLIPSDAVVVEYVLIDYVQPGRTDATSRYIAAIINANDEPGIIDLGNADKIDPLIGSYRRELLRVSKLKHLPTTLDLEAFKNISEKLYHKVFAPIEKYLSGTKLIFLAPDGGLNLVSFAGLLDDDDKYLIEEYSIQYLSSGRDLIRLNEESISGMGLFAFGDPDYDAPALTRLTELKNSENASIPNVQYAGTRNIRSGCSDFANATVQRLPGSRTEVEQIGLSWQKSKTEPVTLCFGSNASEERFKAEAPGKRIIHLATHGYFLEGACFPKTSNIGVTTRLENVEENPLLLSGLFFAGANLHGQGSEIEGAEDGVLTAYEASELNLEGTDMVVLSACETGLGEVKEGEGVYGLRRAFQMAGARTVVSALWPVSDKETASMMSELYTESNETLPEKMRRIQLAKINELRKAGFADHPFTWGAFITMGDWR